MPTITVQWAQGRSLAQKRELTARITKVVAEVANVDSSNIVVYIHDVPDTNLGKNGKLRADGWD